MEEEIAVTTGPAVLVVEDDPLLSSLILRKLQQHFRVMYAQNGEIALDLIKKDKPSLILLDIMLPGIDGFEVLRQTKADAETSSIPVIILSNLGQDSDKAKGKEMGAEQFLVKATVIPSEVVEIVRGVFARDNPQAAQAQ